MTYKVGIQTRSYQDPTRTNWDNTGSRPMVTQIWYPAVDTAGEVEMLIGPPEKPLFRAGLAVPGAQLAHDPAAFPLILLSHGTGGTALQLGWLASFLAAQGYVLAGVNHHGNTALEPYTVQGFVRGWERAMDLTAVLDQLLQDPFFASRIDPQRIGAAGFSLGGYTVLALAGGRIDFSLFKSAYEQAGRKFIDDVPPEFPDPGAFVSLFDSLATSDTDHKQSYRDRRIRAVFAIAPVLGEAFLPESLALIDIPVKIMVGEADTAAAPQRNAIPLAGAIKGAELVIMEGQVAHYTFLAECTLAGEAALPELCTDPPGVNRSHIHAQASKSAADFFDRHLARI